MEEDQVRAINGETAAEAVVGTIDSSFSDAPYLAQKVDSIVSLRAEDSLESLNSRDSVTHLPDVMTWRSSIAKPRGHKTTRDLTISPTRDAVSAERREEGSILPSGPDPEEQPLQQPKAATPGGQRKDPEERPLTPRSILKKSSKYEERPTRWPSPGSGRWRSRERTSPRPRRAGSGSLRRGGWRDWPAVPGRMPGADTPERTSWSTQDRHAYESVASPASPTSPESPESPSRGPTSPHMPSRQLKRRGSNLGYRRMDRGERSPPEPDVTNGFFERVDDPVRARRRSRGHEPAQPSQRQMQDAVQLQDVVMEDE